MAGYLEEVLPPPMTVTFSEPPPPPAPRGPLLLRVSRPLMIVYRQKGEEDKLEGLSGITHTEGSALRFVPVAL